MHSLTPGNSIHGIEGKVATNSRALEVTLLQQRQRPPAPGAPQVLGGRRMVCSTSSPATGRDRDWDWDRDRDWEQGPDRGGRSPPSAAGGGRVAGRSLSPGSTHWLPGREASPVDVATPAPIGWDAGRGAWRRGRWRPPIGRCALGVLVRVRVPVPVPGAAGGPRTSAGCCRGRARGSREAAGGEAGGLGLGRPSPLPAGRCVRVSKSVASPGSGAPAASVPLSAVICGQSAVFFQLQKGFSGRKHARK